LTISIWQHVLENDCNILNPYRNPFYKPSKTTPNGKEDGHVHNNNLEHECENEDEEDISDDEEDGVLEPSISAKSLSLWKDMYLKYNPSYRPVKSLNQQVHEVVKQLHLSSVPQQ